MYSIVVIITLCICGVALEQQIFQHCLKSQPNPGLLNCVGQQAISSLQSIQDIDNYTITNGFIMVKDENLVARSLPNFLDHDPMDFRLVK